MAAGASHGERCDGAGLSEHLAVCALLYASLPASQARHVLALAHALLSPALSHGFLL